MYTLVLPFHSDVSLIGTTVKRAREEGPEHGIKEILLAHNGRPLTAEAQATIDDLVVLPNIRFVHTDAKGIGAGYKLGLAEAREKYVILSADDLPFSWSDVDAFERAGRPDFAIGSKAHRDSALGGVTTKRRIASNVFLMMRKALLGFDTPGDSQGSFILRANLGRDLLPLLTYDHYLFTLELATQHLRRGGRVVELPVTVDADVRPSSVAVIADGWRMTKELVELRQRIKATSRRR